MGVRLHRRLVLVGLLSVAACTTRQELPVFHFRTTNESRQPFFEAIRSFAAAEKLKLAESNGALGTIGFFQFTLTDWRVSITIASDMNAPVGSFGEFNNLFKVEIVSTQEPMPWALHDGGMRALAGRLQSALTAVAGVQVDTTTTSGQTSPP